MPDKKLTDKEIVKALEWCARPLPHCYCGECPAGANGGCAIKTENIIDLINRLQAENEQWQKNCDELYTQMNERLKAELKIERRLAKAEAYKEFAELLKRDSHYVTEGKEEIKWLIGQTLKELVGEDNESKN